ncbi:hypothetical protein ACQKWADRAFT_326659 [Trichoderma austrokoningii]
MASPLIWINGFPGTGKLTIARELARIHPLSILIDNHKLIDPVAAKYARDDPNYQIERKRKRQWAFEQFVFEPARLSEVVIFTDFQSDNELGASTAQEYLDAAQKAGRRFIPVYLSCDVEANIMRATSAERTQGTTTKLTCPDTIRDLRTKCKLFQFGSPYEEFHIDTTDLTPRELSGPTYNVSSNQVVRVESAAGLNSHWVGHWITTTKNLHFLLITFADVVGSGGANGCLIYSLEAGSSSSSYISDAPSTVGQDRLKIQFGEQYELHSLTDDNVSAINVVANFTESNFSLNTTFQPRGSLLFNSGSGSFFWGSDFNQGWASPAAYTTGTFTVNGSTHAVDPKRSTTWYDRQWGDTNPTQGWHWFPIQLDNGIRISTWVLPTDNGSTTKAFATALYPNGRQEVVSVSPDVKPSDPWVSPRTNRTWFGSFEVSFLDGYNSVVKAIAPNVTTRHFGEASFGAGFAFCDAFTLYSGTWKGERVSGWGLVEQWPAS